jgi:signal peptidase I
MAESSEESGLLREGYFLVLAIVLAFGILQFSGTALNTERPVVSVVSCSMYPVYDKGDVLFVKGTDFQSIEEEDIVVFSAPLKVNAEIGNTKYELGEKPVDTPLGLIKVLSVNDNRAILSINGERTPAWEGTSIPVNGEQMRIGEVSGVSIPVVHRVIEKRNNSLETKGDNNDRQLEFEQDIKPEQVYGKVFFRIPKIGLIKLYGMDLIGLAGQPLKIDSFQGCSR